MTGDDQVEPRHEVGMTVNGVHRSARVVARRTLSDYLRHDIGLTGTHVGCEHGVCGACTVLLDGAPVRSCLVFAVSVAGHDVTTVEGLAGNNSAGNNTARNRTARNGTTRNGTARSTAGHPSGDALSPVQQAFRECHALQCGFCTPGFLTTITAGLAQNPTPTRDDAIEMIAGNLCRCTGYHNIVDAVLRAAELTAERED